MKPAAGGFLRLASSRPGDGKRADSGTRRLEDDDAARAERLGHVRQVCHEELDLPARSSRRPTSEENHGRCGLAAHCQEGPEVGVRRDDDATMPTTVATGMRSRRKHGTPPICRGSTVIRRNSIALTSSGLYTPAIMPR